MKLVSEQFNRQRNCPRCKKLHLSEDYWCEYCLFDLLDDQFLEPGRYFIMEKGG
jgi:hypothetical protein